MTIHIDIPFKPLLGQGINWPYILASIYALGSLSLFALVIGAFLLVVHLLDIAITCTGSMICDISSLYMQMPSFPQFVCSLCLGVVSVVLVSSFARSVRGFLS